MRQSILISILFLTATLVSRPTQAALDAEAFGNPTSPRHKSAPPSNRPSKRATDAERAGITELQPLFRFRKSDTLRIDRPLTCEIWEEIG